MGFGCGFAGDSSALMVELNWVSCCSALFLGNFQFLCIWKSKSILCTCQIVIELLLVRPVFSGQGIQPLYEFMVQVIVFSLYGS